MILWLKKMSAGHDSPAELFYYFVVRLFTGHSIGNDGAITVNYGIGWARMQSVG